MEETFESDIKRLTEEVKTLLQSGLTNIVSVGGLLKAAKELSKDDKEFKDWMEKELGKSFYRIAERLILLHETFKDQKVPVPLVTPDAFLALAGEEVSPETIRSIAITGEVELKGKNKKIQDLTKTDIEKMEAQNRKLREILKTKDSEIKELEQDIDSFGKKMSDAVKAGRSEEIEHLKKIIEKKEQDIEKLKKSATKTHEKEKKRRLSFFEAKLQRVFSSEEADAIVIIANELGLEEKTQLKKNLRSLEEQMKQFTQRLGI